MDVKKTTTSTGFKLSVMTLASMNVTAVESLRGLPAEAVYGLSSAFYYLFAAIVFLIPTAMVAAELAAMFSTKQGGVFRWVGEAYGARTGFLAIWLQWIESTIWYPTVLTFGAVSIAFIGMNDAHDATLASNKVFTLCMVLAIYWIATFIALKGLGWVGKISKWGGMIGTIIPAGLLILLGIIYISTGGHNHLDMSQGFFPDLSKFDNLVLASSIFLFYAGMEMMGIHVMDVKNPSRNYPKAIIIGSLVTVCIFVLGTFSLGFIIPAKDISLTQSLLVGFDNYFHYLHMSWAGPIIAIALMFGVLAGVLTWVAGPSKGIFAVGLPEDQQERRTEEYPAHSGLRRDAAGAAVRGDALGAVVLPDTFAADRTAVPDHVHADVLGGDRAALQDEEHRPPVPPGQGQRPDVVPGLSGFLRSPAGLRPELRTAQPDLDRQQHRLVLGAHHRLRGSRGRPVRDLRHAQTGVERPRGRGRLRPVPLGAAARRSGSGTYQRSRTDGETFGYGTSQQINR